MSIYLVTGVAGFIASTVCEQLIGEGHTVLGVDNLNDAYDVRLKEWRLQRLRKLKGFEFTKADINDREALRPLFKRGPAAVVNLAARAGVRQSLEAPGVYIETNISGTVTLLELCREHGVGRFLLASTSSLYGAANPRPFREDADTNRPLSPYAASKKGAEAVCHAYHHLYGIHIVIPRYFTVYGPAGRPDMSLFRFTQWVSEERPVIIYGDGSQSRDFTFVEDIARGTIGGLRLDGYNIINLGSDQPAALRTALDHIAARVGKKPHIQYRPMHPADVLATWADISRARNLLGWEPHTSLEQGLGALVDWYMVNRSWAKDILTD